MFEPVPIESPVVSYVVFAPADALVNREPGTQREEQQQNDEAPEVDFSSMSERMVGISFLFRAMNAVKQKYFVCCVDHRVDGFTRHRGTASPRGRHDLANANKHVPA